MVLAIVTWIILLFRPRFVFLFALGLASLVFALPRLIAAQSREELLLVGLSFAVGWAILFLVGASIIVVRKWFLARATSAERQADRELERIRAEAASRDVGAPPSA